MTRVDREGIVIGRIEGIVMDRIEEMIERIEDSVCVRIEVNASASVIKRIRALVNIS